MAEPRLPAPILNVLRVGMRLYFVDELYHVRAFVDDYVVLRHWHRAGHRWEYSCKPRHIVERRSLYSPISYREQQRRAGCQANQLINQPTPRGDKKS